jgi:ABC-2 type transport system ATP-binding protein
MAKPRPKTDDAISVKGLEKSFKNLKVLEGISFEVKRGTVLALLAKLRPLRF